MDCETCRKKCQTPFAEYFEPSQIRYCREQLLFLIANLETLAEGRYPSDPQKSEISSQRSGGDAGFVNPTLICLDLKTRLDRCKADGRTLVHEVQVLEVTKVERLSQSARNALDYCSGSKGRKMGYAMWLADRERNKKNHKSMVFKKL